MPGCSMWVHKLLYIALGVLALAACAANSQARQLSYWWHFLLKTQHPLECISCVFIHTFQSTRFLEKATRCARGVLSV